MDSLDYSPPTKQLKLESVNVCEKSANKTDDFKEDGSSTVNDESTPPADKIASKFPIDPGAIEFIPKSVKLTLFVSRLMEYLFDDVYLTTHSLTGKRGTVGVINLDGKSPMKEEYLKGIIGKRS